jgi:hypothetical protein
VWAPKHCFPRSCLGFQSVLLCRDFAAWGFNLPNKSGTWMFDGNVSAFLFTLEDYQRGSTEQMSKYVPFLHSEASHSLPLYPVGTVFALN